MKNIHPEATVIIQWARALALCCLIILCASGCTQSELSAAPEAKQQPQDAPLNKDEAGGGSAPTQMPIAPKQVVVAEGKITSGDTLAGVMMHQGVNGVDARKAVDALIKAGVDVRRVQLGRPYVVETDGAGQLLHFSYAEGPSHRFQVDASPLGEMRATRSEGRVELREMVIKGSIESNLSQAVYESGGGNALTQLMVDVFQWDINFYTDPRVGDTFEVMFLKEYVDGQSTGHYDQILSARYNGSFVGERQVIYFGDDYFDSKGRYARKNFLLAPLDVLRVSSKYGQRFHPIHKKWKAHTGVDYGARQGTSVWAVADGKVVSVQRRKSGYGNSVRVRHSNGYETLYAHLHRINVVQGQRVKQKMKIGSVGMTGTATAPHLHFEVRVNGKRVNPQKQKMIPGRPIPKSKRGAFEAERLRLNEKIAATEAQGPVASQGANLPHGWQLLRDDNGRF